MRQLIPDESTQQIQSLYIKKTVDNLDEALIGKLTK